MGTMSNQAPRRVIPIKVEPPSSLSAAERSAVMDACARLKALPGALLPILLPALERNGHLHLAVTMRQKILAMSASTIDRLLREPRSATRLRKARRAMPAARTRLRVRQGRPHDARTTRSRLA